MNVSEGKRLCKKDNGSPKTCRDYICRDCACILTGVCFMKQHLLRNICLSRTYFLIMEYERIRKIPSRVNDMANPRCKYQNWWNEGMFPSTFTSNDLKWKFNKLQNNSQ